MKIPDDLSADSQKLWAKIVRGTISPSRAELLHQGLLCRDRLAQVRGALAAAELTSTTPKTGAVHVHPLLKIEAELRRQFATIWGQLNLQWRADIDGMARFADPDAGDEEADL